MTIAELESARLDERAVGGETQRVLTASEYYKDPNVRRRIAEYCGGTSEDPGEFTAEYLVGYGADVLREGRSEPFVSSSCDGFATLLDRGLDIFRSNWDRAGTLGIMDIEYFNLDFPGETYLNPKRSFEVLEPTRAAVRILLDRFQIPYLEIMTGQGYHFASRVARGSQADSQLIELGRVGVPLAGKYAHSESGSRRHRCVSHLHGRSFDGMGRLLEYVAQGVMRMARSQSSVPIVTTDVAVGAGKHGREAVSIDLSMFADPIFMRDIRCPFSTHQKHKVQLGKVGAQIASEIPIQICLPVGRNSLDDSLAMRRHFRRSADWAAACGPTTIPDGSEGFLHLIDEYRRSRLAEFHRAFDAADHDPWTAWSRTYDALDLTTLPPCVAYSLENPNPNLLRPTNLQTLTRTLMGMGWHPRHIAGLVRSKYERDHGWGREWAKYDAATRADFYIRIFAGQIATGLDLLLDHNCVSHQEKGYCLRPWCGSSLGQFKS